jgi:hypothetical protein
MRTRRVGVTVVKSIAILIQYVLLIVVLGTAVRLRLFVYVINIHCVAYVFFSKVFCNLNIVRNTL